MGRSRETCAGEMLVSITGFVAQQGAQVRRSYGQPVDLVRVDGVSSATSILLITGAVDDDGVFKCACICV